MSRTTRTSALVALAVTAGAAGALVSACSSSPAGTAKDASDPASGVVINVGDQQQELETLLNASGVLNGASYQVNEQAHRRERVPARRAELWLRHEPAVLLVTHDVDEAIALADRVLMLDRGVITYAIPVALDRPRDPGSPGFINLRRQLLTELGVPLPEDDP